MSAHRTQADERAGLSGASDLQALLTEAAELGWSTVLITRDEGRLCCAACRNEVGADRLHVEAHRRLEGASDPADMQLVAAARCPHCGAPGVLTLGYGPNADERSSDVLADLDLPGNPRWPPPPADQPPPS